MCLPVTLLHQSLPLLLAGVLLPLVGLVQDLLGCRPPFEAVAPHFLTGGFDAHLFAGLTHALTGWIELCKIITLIWISFVSHTAARTMSCLVEL